MIGSDISPIEMTEADTTPVVAASIAPTNTTAMASPPRTAPNSWPIVSSRSSAMPERSSTSPISVKNGTASSVSLEMMPNTRCGSAWNSEELSRPSSMPTRPNRIPLAARANATGKPSNRKMISVANMIGARLAMKNSMISDPCYPVHAQRPLRALALHGRFLRPVPLRRSWRPRVRAGRGSAPSGSRCI
ncbi:hypothetical protein G6F22_018671 [Rhizopus arrhizus]|nr:hypothetical protein G6F22_018671 [Rhizopus arrhizus]